MQRRAWQCIVFIDRPRVIRTENEEVTDISGFVTTISNMASQTKSKGDIG